MILNKRHALVWTTCALLAYAIPSEARQKTVRQDKDLAPSMACSTECGKQHGSGKKNEIYNRNAYESCMVECMRATKKKRSPGGTN